MQTIFDKTNRDELIKRINALNENSKAQWGKMNICQMLKHCIKWRKWQWVERNTNSHFLDAYWKNGIKGFYQGRNTI